MRLHYALVTFLFALTCAERIGVREGLHLRQADQTDTPATTTNNDAPTSTATSDNTATTDGPTTTDSASKETTTNDAQSKTSSPTGDATTPITMTGTASASPSSTVMLPGPSNSTNDGKTLPIQPSLNPALGIGGVILMICGLGLGFVGIKHRETQTFISTALLVALAIEVLIIYLMHPPVPVAIQGAYLVAGVCGGGLLGGLALIFKEVSEGFGCVLGGFCFAMWLLVLRPGGLIQNSVGKIILIAVLCAAGYCTYISRFTRDYGLIACTSFAGASAFIIGIDCFGQAGLKEFWMYIWDLNDNVFPLFTDTYPITRNMRVEIAAIVIVAFLGTMSQIKIWKIVREQKQKRDAQRIQDEEARDALEEEVGRDVENRNRESLAHWQGYYDGKKQPEVSVQSGTASVDDFGKDGDTESRSGSSYPLVNIRSASASHHRSSISVRMSSQDHRYPVPPLELDDDGNPVDRSNAETRTHPDASSERNEKASSYRETIEEGITPSSEPETPGLHAREESPAARRNSVNVKRLSVRSLHQKNALEAASAVPENPFIEEEDDVASSIAATAAEAPDADALSTRLSRPNSMYLSHGARNSTATLPVNDEEIIEDDDEEALYPGRKDSAGTHLDPSNPRSSGDGHEPGAQQNYSDGAGEKQELAERLPKRISKAATRYRTNEWAKEVSRAEPEPIEEELERDEEAVRIEMGNAAASARADANNAAPAPPPQPKVEEAKPDKKRLSNRLSQRLSRTLTPVYSHKPQPSEDDWSIPLAKRASSNPALNVDKRSTSTSTPNLEKRSSSNPVPSMENAQPKPHGPVLDTSRNASTPILGQPILESPVESPPEKARNFSQLMRRQSNLLDARQDRLDNRLTTTSFMTPNSSTPALVEEGRAMENSGSHDGSQQGDQASFIGKNEEDMTLAERKAMVQQQQRQSSYEEGQDTIRPMASRHVSQTYSQMPPVQEGNATPPPPLLHRLSSAKETKPLRMSSTGASKPLYDSHQPRRASSHNANKQAMNWSMWRSSNAVANTSRQPIMNTDSQMDMLRAARIQSDNEARAKEEQRKARQDQIDAHMRMGGMNDAHRAAIARMQGEANRKAG